MSMVRAIQSESDKNRASVQKLLDELQADLHAGKIEALCVVIERPGQHYGLRTTRTNSKRQTIGALFEIMQQLSAEG